ncbi:rCG33796, isoform CRA_a [Rattus norvegicus]|uniref:RCG33796, isoform CRA_a n=1 Tax=Rattus norvegicus TaxID=10116 RepID=A6HLC8_RAT|nr:rCG33796, isoform CRA_a [Rattus norvegicus]
MFPLNCLLRIRKFLCLAAVPDGCLGVGHCPGVMWQERLSYPTHYTNLPNILLSLVPISK